MTIYVNFWIVIKTTAFGNRVGSFKFHSHFGQVRKGIGGYAHWRRYSARVKSKDSESLMEDDYCRSGSGTGWICFKRLLSRFQRVESSTLFFLFWGVLGCFDIYMEEARSPRVYSTAKHSGTTDEDGCHGSLTELTREGPSGGPKGLGPRTTPTQRTQT